MNRHEGRTAPPVTHACWLVWRGSTSCFQSSSVWMIQAQGALTLLHSHHCESADLPTPAKSGLHQTSNSSPAAYCQPCRLPHKWTASLGWEVTVFTCTVKVFLLCTCQLLKALWEAVLTPAGAHWDRSETTGNFCLLRYSFLHLLINVLFLLKYL